MPPWGHDEGGRDNPGPQGGLAWTVTAGGGGLRRSGLRGWRSWEVLSLAFAEPCDDGDQKIDWEEGGGEEGTEATCGKDIVGIHGLRSFMGYGLLRAFKAKAPPAG